MRFSLAARVIIVLIGLLVLAACRGSHSNENQSPVAEIDPQLVLAQASERFDQITSLHFTLQVKGNVALDSANTLALHGAEGDLARPSSAQGKADITFMGANLSIQFVSIERDQYITNPISGSWETAPSNLGYDPAVLFDNDRGIANVLNVLQDPTIAGTERIDGQDAYHLTATVNRVDAEPLAAGAFSGEQLGIDLWITKEHHDLIKLILNDDRASGTNTTWILLISDQNKPVSIQRPEI